MTRSLVSGVVIALIAFPSVAIAQIFLYQTSPGQRGIGKYTLSGAPTDSPLVRLSGPSFAAYLASSENDLFVSDPFTARIGKYNAVTGAPINESLISGFAPGDIALWGSNLFVADPVNGAIGLYSTSGATVNAALIIGLQGPQSIVVSDQNVWVLNGDTGTIGKYTTSGGTVSASLVTGLVDPVSMAFWDGKLFVLSRGGEIPPSGAIAVYDATTGAVINPALLSGLNQPQDIAAFGGNLLVTIPHLNRVSQYSTSGATINASLIVAGSPWAIAVVPEPMVGLLAVCVWSLIPLRRR